MARALPQYRLPLGRVAYWSDVTVGVSWGYSIYSIFDMEIGFGFQWRLSFGLLGSKKVSMPKNRSVDTFHTQKSDIANLKIFSITATIFFLHAML
jgi:hypothetical protein